MSFSFVGIFWPLIGKAWDRMEVLASDVEVLVVSTHLFPRQGILGHVVILWEPTLALTMLSTVCVDKVEVVEFWVV